MENNKEQSSPFGPEGEKPLKDNPEWKGFDFKEDVTAYQLFQDIFNQKTTPSNSRNFNNMKNKTKEFLLKIKDSFKNLTILRVIGILIIIYICLLVYKEIKPLNWKEQQIECLELGSDSARARCLKIINE